jgi:hypothetical protein
MSYRLNAALALALLLAAGAVPAGAAAQPAAAAGPETLRPDEQENLQDSAAVIVINELQRQGDLGGKLFGTAGGDPAMNGLYTYLAFHVSPAEGWRVFRIGDFLSYSIVSEAPGRVLLEVQESIMNEASGEIGGRTRRLELRWTGGPDNAPPATVTVAPAG